MARDPGIGELTGRIDDLEDRVDSLRRIILTFVTIGLVAVLPYLELRERKGGKDVD